MPAPSPDIAPLAAGGTLTGGRRNGRSTIMRLAAEAHATAGGHVHLAGRDGIWGVTRQPIGYLYMLIHRPSRAVGEHT